MTQQPQKMGERFFAEQAAKLLGKTWCLSPDRERPDFIVSDSERQFGLEVCEIFTGPQNPDGYGAKMKKNESENQKAVNALRCEYEAICNIPLGVRLTGDVCATNMTGVVPALVTRDLSSKPYGHQEIIDVDDGPARLRVHVTRALRADWFCVNDRVGWVDITPIKHIVRAIEKKSEKLRDYKKCAGLDDIRLLIVANHLFSSGMLTLQERTKLDLRGFQFVYFFSYPESITVFD